MKSKDIVYVTIMNIFIALCIKKDAYDQTEFNNDRNIDSCYNIISIWQISSKKMVAIIYGFSMHNKHLASFLKGGGLIRSEIYSRTKKFLIRICSKSKGGGG